jgi:hypothetical protein
VADYINKNILSQAYIHIESDIMESDERMESFERKITEFTKSRSAFFMSPDAPIEIELEDGSLKARITIMGTICLLLQGISNYKNFREGIQLIYSDSKRMTEYIIAESVFLAGARQEKVMRIEARVGVIGSVQKIINQLDQIKRGANGRDLASKLSDKLISVSEEIDKLIDNLSDDKDVNVVSTGLLEVLDEIPSYPTAPDQKENTIGFVRSYQEQRKKLRIRLKSVADNPIK